MKTNFLRSFFAWGGMVALTFNAFLPWFVAYAENIPGEGNEVINTETPAEESVETPDTPEVPANDTTSGEWQQQADETPANSGEENDTDAPVAPVEWQQVIEKTTDSMSTFDDTGTCNGNAVACIGTTWYESLQTAVNTANNETITLINDINFSWAIEIKKPTTINLNWHSISTSNSYLIDLYDNLSLEWTWTLESTFSSDPDRGTAIWIDGNEKTLNVWEWITVKWNNWIVIWPDLDNHKFTVNLSWTIQANYIWFSINGTITDDSNSPTLNVWSTAKINATQWTAIYLAWYWVTTIADWAEITWENSAIEIRAWKLIINWWTFTSTAEREDVIVTPNSNWPTTVWAALAIAQHTTKKEISVEINWWTFNWIAAVNQANPQENDNIDSEKVTTTVISWTFNWNVVNIDENSKLEINWWTFSDTVPSEYLAEGANISVVDAEAKIWSIEYKTLADAIEASKDWNTISLLKDVEVKWKSYELNDPSSDVSLKIANKNITIEWENKTVKYDHKPTWVSNWANFLFKIYGSTVILNNLKITNSLGAIIVWENSNVTLNNVDLDWNEWYWIDTKAWLNSLVLNNVTRTDGLFVNNDCRIEWNNCDLEPLWNKLSWTTVLTWVKTSKFTNYTDVSWYIKYSYIPAYTVTFDNDWALTSETIIYSGTVSGGQVIAPEEPTKEWYNFTGWYDWENKVVFPYVITGDKTLTCHWEAIQYTITYELSGWVLSWDDTNPEAYTIESDAITLNNPIRTWYTFTWWSGTDIEWINESVTIAKWSTWNRNYEANWEINQYTITFDTDGWSAIATITWDYGQIVPSVANPTKECNSFAGWDKELPTTMPAENITLKATWNYTCSRSSWGGGGSSRSSSDDVKEVVLGWEVEVNTWDKAEINTWDENKLPENTDGNNWNGNDSNYDPELVAAYEWAYKNGITTMDTIEKARLNDRITRAELAKMMVVFMSWVLQKEPVITGNAGYKDVSEKGQGDLAWYIELAYQYQIMWINADGKALQNFNPNGKVSRAEFATVLSRVLYGSKYNQSWANYYELHIQALSEAKILKDTNPAIKEFRGWILLMLYRSQNGELNNNSEENTNEVNVNTWDVAELTWTVAETTTWSVAEQLTWAVVDLTWAVAELTWVNAELTWVVAELTWASAELTWSNAELTGSVQEAGN